MNSGRSIWKALLAAAVLLLQMHSLAQAGMGGDENSVEGDRKAIHGIRRVRDMATYRVHEITTETNTVREFVRSDGTVFAVAWSGISHPDLSQILGGYYTEFLAADQATPTPKGRASKHVQSVNMHSLRAGHMRDLHFKAWDPALVPAGFDLNQVE